LPRLRQSRRADAVTTPTPFRDRKVFASLDGLRAIAVFGVVWHHVARGRPLFFAEQGALGVQLFFVISGFLIATLLLREKRRTNTIALRAFYVRRALRIFPLYYVALLVRIVVVALFAADSSDGAAFFGNLKYFATFTSNWFVGSSPHVIFAFAWSLAAEEQFYVVWAPVERFLSKWLAALLAASLLVLWWLATNNVLPLDQASFAHTLLV